MLRGLPVPDALLRDFLIVARHGSFSRAAADAGVSQPALSRRIRELEERLGSRLFDRHGRGVRLTRQGEGLLARIAPAFLEIDSAVEELSERREAATGLMAIASIHTLNAYFMPPVLEAFRREHPHARFRLLGRSSEDAVDLTQRGVVDLGIVYGTLVLDERIEAIHLFDEDIVIAYNAQIEGAEVLRKGTLPAGLPLVAFPRGYALRSLVDRVTLGLSADFKCEAETLDALIALVELGVGASLLPRPAIQDRVLAGKLAMATMQPRLTRQVVIVSRRGEAKPPLVRALHRSLLVAAKVYRSGKRSSA